MAVLSKLRVLSNERLELTDLLQIDNQASADWTSYIKRMLVGSASDSTGKSYVVRGFEVVRPEILIGTATDTISIRMAKSSVLYTETGAPGAFFVAPDDAADETVTINLNATNYIQFSLTTETGAAANRAFWDEVNEEEFVSEIDTLTNLKVEWSVSTSAFASGKIPVAKIVCANGSINSITDSRHLLFRLATGGDSPSSTHDFPFLSRSEVVTVDTNGGTNPFNQGDKGISSMKQWMDAVMTRIKELSGGTEWYAANHNLLQTHAIFDKVSGSWAINAGANTVDLPSVRVSFPMSPIAFALTAAPGIADFNDYDTLLLKYAFDEIVTADGVAITFGFTNGSNTVTTSVDLSSAGLANKFIKSIADGPEKYVQVSSVDATTITLASNYAGTTGVSVYGHLAYTVGYEVKAPTDTFSMQNRFWLAKRIGSNLIIRPGLS